MNGGQKSVWADFSVSGAWRVADGPKKLQYIEDYCPGGSQFLRLYFTIVGAKGQSHKGGNNKKGVTIEKKSDLSFLFWHYL